MTESTAEVLFGTAEPVPSVTIVRAGSLTLELRAGRVWHIRASDVEVWHGIAFLYRDADWRTPEPQLELVDASIGEDAFCVRYAGHIPTTPAMDVEIEVTGLADCRIRFSVTGTPRGDLPTNRTGLCVMHSCAVSGARVEVEHVDGRRSLSTFPTLIPPVPPFTLVRGIRHEYAPGQWAQCRFEGDSFELEDQRNNGDASFKTYSRSNMLPRPYLIEAGTAITQSVDLWLEPPVRLTPPRRVAQAVTISIGDETPGPCEIGLSIRPEDIDAAAEMRAGLCELAPPILHLGVEGGQPIDWQKLADLLEATRSRLRLDIELAAANDAERVLHPLAASMRAGDVAPASVAVFPSSARCFAVARDCFPAAAIGGGTPHFFVQLNRQEQLGPVDFLAFTVASIVHGADDDSVMLGLQSLPAMIRTLRERWPGKRICVGPSAIAARRSPLGDLAATDGKSRVALAGDDPRARGLFGAAWMLGHVAQLIAAGADAASLRELTGPAGLVASEGGRLERYPAYFAFQQLCRAERFRQVSVSEPTKLAAIAFSDRSGMRLLLANLTGQRVDFRIDGPAARWDATVVYADTWRSFAQAANAVAPALPSPAMPGRLDAYAFAMLTPTRN